MKALMQKLQMPLKIKLSLLITTLLVLTVVIVSILLLRQQQQALTAEMIKRGFTIADNLAAGGKSALVANDDLTLNVLVKQAMLDGDIAYVIFADEDGVVRAHSDVAAIGRPLMRPSGLEPLGDQPQVREYKTDGRGQIVDFGVPLVFSGVRVGELYLGFSKEAITAALGRSRNQAAVVTAIMIVVGLGGAVGLATLLSRPIFRLVTATQAIARGDFNVTLPVVSRDELGVLTESFNHMARNLREKEMIKRAFTRYVAREVVEEILKDPEHLVLVGERREVTVLFCDIRGFTSMSERMTPEEVVSLLNEFYTLMVEMTFKHDGTLDKFLGDAVMAVFGAPIAHADHALRAVRAALDMQAGIVELNNRRAAKGKDPFQVGIGVNLGEVVAGTVGTEDRMEYTVIGDSVNVAARLQAHAKPGSILVSRVTYERVQKHVDAVSLGPLRVKGKEEELEVFEVVR